MNPHLRLFTSICMVFYFAAPLVTAQVEVPSPIGKCATVNLDSENAAGPQRRGYAIPGKIFFVPGNLCSAYTWHGWEETMRLYLGEGAEEYRELIERAVEVWNEAVTPRSGEPLIEIVDYPPWNDLLSESFWADTEEGRAKLLDGENVIYFKPDTDGESGVWGYAWRRRKYSADSSSYKMAEADIYINTANEEEYKPDTLTLTKLLVDVDDSSGAYAIVNKTYEVILHELGHAVGIEHIPVSGNVMSKDFGAGGLDQWSAPMAIELFKDPDPEANEFVDLHSHIFPYMIVREESLDILDRVEFFTQNAKLGEQEKAVLMCIYEY